MDIAAEADLIPTLTDPLSLGRRVLLFAPHPDDEVFGCGGTLCLLAAAGTRISVVVVSDGALGGDGADLIEQREGESRTAAQLLGYSPPVFWRLPDRGVRYGETLVVRILAAIETAQADLIFAPAPTEIHPDHQAIAMAAAEALRRLGGDSRLALYEVSAPLSPNALVDISAVEARKLEAMRCFRSQLTEQPYDDRIASLNRYRAYPLGPRATAAEAFCIAKASELEQGIAPLFESALARRHRLGFAVAASDIPLVSIVVRSMDRASLGEALTSLALQTYDNVEIVVVNAKGGTHAVVGEDCGRFPMRIVNQGGAPLSRPQAANAGLDAARGAYLALLDDDDTLDPDHLVHLVAAIQAESQATVAYAGVRCIDKDDRERRVTRIFGEPLESTAQLLAGNFIPIHAPLFPRNLLEHARFDETLEAYEDWDFWLQLTRLARFVYVNRVTATYYTGGTSGVSPQTPDWDAVRRATRMLFAKWIKTTPDEFKAICDLYHRSRADLLANQAEATRLQQMMQDHDVRLAEALAQLAETRSQCDTAGRQLQEVLSSTSWNLTKPLRLLKTAVSSLAGRLVRRP